MQTESLHDAKTRAMREHKLMCLVFLSTLHPDYSYFKSTLFSIFQRLDDYFVCWYGVVNNRKNQDAVLYQSKYNVASFPFCVVIDPHTMKPFDSIPLSSQLYKPDDTTLLTKLRMIANAYQQYLLESRQQSERKSQEEQLKRSQEQAFIEAEALAKKKRDDEAEAEKKRLDNLRSQEDYNKKLNERRRRKAQVEGTPIDKESGSLKVGIRLPSGKRLDKEVNRDVVLSYLYDCVSDEANLDVDNIILITNFPRMEFPESETPLSQFQFKDRVLFFVEYKA
ncbi:hypothetical protein GEMRC1_005255 [Eukaryota sp. GEM-RC1]